MLDVQGCQWLVLAVAALVIGVSGVVIRFARRIPEKVFVWLVQLLAAVGAIELMF